MLRKHILKKLEKEGIGQRQLAKIANVNESTISRYLNEYDELKFESTLKIVKYLFPDEERELMAEYVLTQKNQNARHCLEYCLQNSLKDEAEQVIDKLLASTNPADREWAKVYRINQYRLNKQMDHTELLEELKKFYPSSLEVQIMHTFIIAYVYYDMNKHNLLYELLEDLESSIEQVTSQFIMDCFYSRYGMLLNVIFLYQNKVEQAKKYSYKVIELASSAQVKAKALQYLGNLYLFEDFEKANHYIEEALKLLNNTNRKNHILDVTLTQYFTKSYWNTEYKFTLSLDSDTIKNYFAYHLIKKGEVHKAIEILYQIDLDTLPEWDRGFYYYFRGLVEKDTDLFYHSVKWFRHTENFFHLHLPLQELQKKEEKAILLDIFAQ